MEGIISFAHTMGHSVVAEGIEDQNMEEMVKNMKADFGQGYMYAKPISDQEIIRLIVNEI
jgi:EAL domain-containing protein (putative c-di-GMP-specific phosphodiesterase class I)